MSEWQDIGSAPRDGSEVLVYDGNPDAIYRAVVATFASHPALCPEGRWQTTDGGYVIVPSHWTEMPSNPPCTTST